MKLELPRRGWERAVAGQVDVADLAPVDPAAWNRVGFACQHYRVPTFTNPYRRPVGRRQSPMITGATRVKRCNFSRAVFE